MPNPNHDARGRFASKGGKSGRVGGSMKKKSAVAALRANQQSTRGGVSTRGPATKGTGLAYLTRSQAKKAAHKQRVVANKIANAKAAIKADSGKAKPIRNLSALVSKMKQSPLQANSPVKTISRQAMANRLKKARNSAHVKAQPIQYRSDIARARAVIGGKGYMVAAQKTADSGKAKAVKPQGTIKTLKRAGNASVKGGTSVMQNGGLVTKVPAISIQQTLKRVVANSNGKSPYRASVTVTSRGAFQGSIGKNVFKGSGAKSLSLARKSIGPGFNMSAKSVSPKAVVKPRIKLKVR